MRLHYDSGDFEDITVDDIPEILIEIFSTKGGKTLPFELKKPSDGILYRNSIIFAGIYEDLSENEKVKFVIELKKTFILIPSIHNSINSVLCFISYTSSIFYKII